MTTAPSTSFAALPNRLKIKIRLAEMLERDAEDAVSIDARYDFLDRADALRAEVEEALRMTTELDLVIASLGVNSGAEAALRNLVTKHLTQAYDDGYRNGHHATKYAVERFLSDRVTIEHFQEGDES